MSSSTNIENRLRPRPDYADFDDQRLTQHTVVAVRWFIIVAWLSINHYRTTITTLLVLVDLIGFGVILLNTWLQIRLIQGRPDQVIHRRINHHKFFIVILLNSDNPG